MPSGGTKLLNGVGGLNLGWLPDSNIIDNETGRRMPSGQKKSLRPLADGLTA